MTLSNCREISLDEEAKTGLLSLVKQSAQVGAGLFGLLLLTGGNPPVYVMALGVVGGIVFVAWQDKNARFTNSVGISEELKQDLIEWGAIFEDNPPSGESVSSPRSPVKK
ncbi:hypothetical protein [Pseudanabaena sp. PCC 6802]|uniref:hypothetical protein n=1 Tax=Pseudanabaena sp. PCC 6802 TaxID=118173 RepID=UPI00034C4B1D|nr:hypothetical protein [Pseudanabaena sp. PCC 6802]